MAMVNSSKHDEASTTSSSRCSSSYTGHLGRRYHVLSEAGTRIGQIDFFLGNPRRPCKDRNNVCSNEARGGSSSGGRRCRSTQRKRTRTYFFVAWSSYGFVSSPVPSCSMYLCDFDRDVFNLTEARTTAITTMTTKERWVNLPCHHSFHEHCIVPWLMLEQTCPWCRRTSLLFIV